MDSSSAIRMIRAVRRPSSCVLKETCQSTYTYIDKMMHRFRRVVSKVCRKSIDDFQCIFQISIVKLFMSFRRSSIT
jgi:hypothetical protein